MTVRKINSRSILDNSIAQADISSLQPTVTGGSIDGATIGGTTASTGKFTEVTTPKVASASGVKLSVESTGTEGIDLKVSGSTVATVNGTGVTGTLGAVTLAGAVTGGGQNVSGLGTVSCNALTISNTPLTVASGGTGAAAPADALNNLLPSGEASGFVLKTNGPGTYFWAAETGASANLGTTIDSSRTSHTADVTTTVWSCGTYVLGASQLRIYINGVRQFSTAYSETSTTSFTISPALPAGSLILAEVDGYNTFSMIASAVTFTPSGGLGSNNVQSALAELDSEKASLILNGAVTNPSNYSVNFGTGALTAGALSASGIVTIGGTSQLTGAAPDLQIYHGTSIKHLIGGTAVTTTSSTGLSVIGSGTFSDKITINKGAVAGAQLDIYRGAAACTFGVDNGSSIASGAGAGDTVLRAANAGINGFRFAEGASGSILATLDSSGSFTLNKSLGGVGADAAILRLQAGGTDQRSARLISYVPSGAAGVDYVGLRITTNNGTTNTVNAAYFDPAGNVGIGVTPSAWNAFKSIDIGPTGSIAGYQYSDQIAVDVSANKYSTSLAADVYRIDGVATAYRQHGGSHLWKTAGSGTQGNAITWKTAMTLDVSGNLLLGIASTFYSNYGGAYYSKGNGSRVVLGRENAGGGSIQVFTNYQDNAVGSISVTDSATTYSTSSDYRLKDNPQPLTGSGAFIDALKPKTWIWKIDGSRGVGFIAHEAQEVSPSSVTGEKDGEEMQSMEYGSAEFIANIVAELQSLRARVAIIEGAK